MYVARKLHVKQYDFESPEERYSVQLVRDGKPVPGIQLDRISFVEEELVHWWKAFHIHDWFVRNVQNGNDDCREYYVDDKHLRELISVCTKVIQASKLVSGMVYAGTWWEPGMKKAEERGEPGRFIKDPTVAKKLLPVREGYWTEYPEYDERYLNAVIKTRAWAEHTLANNEAGVPGEIFYSSSW